MKTNKVYSVYGEAGGQRFLLGSFDLKETALSFIMNSRYDNMVLIEN